MGVLICLMTSAITERNARKWHEKKSVLIKPTGTKTPMCRKRALESDLPIPRSAFPTFPFEAYLDSPGRTQHDQRRLVPLR